ncbi:MAG: hypothetical protein WDN49_21280 [Acetobacteraceae bacterium]
MRQQRSDDATEAAETDKARALPFDPVKGEAFEIELFLIISPVPVRVRSETI